SPRISQPLTHASIEMRTTVQRNDSRLVHLLLENSHVPGSLHNLVIVVVSGGNTRQRTADNTTRVQRQVFRAVVRTAARETFIRSIEPVLLRQPLLTVRRKRRDTPISGI